MTRQGQPFTSGEWHVMAGREEEFVKAWTEFTEWAKSEAAGADSFVLIQDRGDPRHFLSFGGWDSFESVDAWRGRDEFKQYFGRCRAMCDEMQAGDFVVASFVG